MKNWLQELNQIEMGTPLKAPAIKLKKESYEITNIKKRSNS